MRLITGPALDAALEAIKWTIGHEPTQDEALVACKCTALVEGYNNHWSNQGWESVEVEEQTLLPIINPNTGKASRKFQQAGKWDGIVKKDGKTYLRENKTCSEDICAPNASYWRRLNIDSQVSSYMLANWQQGRKLDGTLYDVVRKPTIRPKELLKTAIARIAFDGTYCGAKVPPSVQESVTDRSQTVECITLYGLRLRADIKERPTYYFARRMVPRLDHELLEWAQELWDVGQEISTARKENRHYRNSDACMTWGRPCEYLGICSGHDTPDSDKWYRSPCVHEELQWDGDKDGKDVLTNSRIRCFQTCRRKHFYRYELGLRRVDDEDRDARYFGHVWHAAMAAWWGCFKVGCSDERGNETKRHDLPQNTGCP